MCAVIENMIYNEKVTSFQCFLKFLAHLNMFCRPYQKKQKSFAELPKLLCRDREISVTWF